MKLFELLYPKMCAQTLADVDIDMLENNGIKAVILDLDNTILPWKDCDVPDRSMDWIRKAKERGISLCIVSNTHNPRRLRSVAASVDIAYIDRGGKPRRKGMRTAIKKMGSTIDTTAIIGDQLYTDILGGNRLCILTILVRPLHSREFFGTKISRLFEKPVLARIAHKHPCWNKESV